MSDKYDCWAGNKGDIFLPPCFPIDGFEPDKWYSSQEAGIWLKSVSSKFKLANYEIENDRMTKDNDKFNANQLGIAYEKFKELGLH
jgi:hypothetical protein